MSDTSTRTEERAVDAPARRLRLPGRGGGTPLFRNAFALMLNTGISAVLGVGFWLVAARYYSEDSVGQSSAAIAAMKLLAGLTAVTLTGALARFIPVAGRTTGRLVFRTYAASSLLVAAAAGVFLLTLGLWGPSYHFLHGLLPGLGFMAAVVAWSVLTLQDGVLTGLRSALWVPVGNTVFSAVKLALLVGLAAALPMSGVFVSWVVSIAVSVVPLGWLVFRRLVPAHVRATEESALPASYREMGRFLAGDYTGSLFSLAVVYLVPVIVAAQVSSTDNAYFYITSTIGGTVNLLAINMGASLTVEGSHDPARLADNCRAALRRMAKIMVPVCVLLFALAPYILQVFGRGYAEAATPLLRWFAVGAALRVVMEVYFAVLRAQSRTAGLAYLQGLLCALVLGLTLILLPRMGLTGGGGRGDQQPDRDRLDRGGQAAGRPEGRARRRARWRQDAARRGPRGSAGARRPQGRDGGRAGGGRARHALGAALGAGRGHHAAGRAAGLRPSGAAAGPAAHACRGAWRRRSGRRRPRALRRSRSGCRPCRPRGKPPGRPCGRGAVAWWRTPVAGIRLLAVAALAMYWVPLEAVGSVDLEGMGGFGLVSVLPVATLLGGPRCWCWPSRARCVWTGRAGGCWRRCCWRRWSRCTPCPRCWRPSRASRRPGSTWASWTTSTAPAPPRPTWTPAGAGRASSRSPCSRPGPAV
ncbi:hypothetical protein GCM10020000_63910 [Streptomyces olivoverticillatus]